MKAKSVVPHPLVKGNQDKVHAFSKWKRLLAENDDGDPGKTKARMKREDVKMRKKRNEKSI
jgi:hypothetical protein